MPRSSPALKKTALSPRKLPFQARATMTRDAILQAAARILERDGLSAFNTNRVAQVAGISVGSLYQYYPHKAALLCALSVQHNEDFLQNLDAVITNTGHLPLAKLLSKLIAVALKHQFDRAPLAAALDFAEQEYQLEAVLKPYRQLLLASVQSALARHSHLLTGDLKTRTMDCLTIVQAMIDSAAARGEKNTLALRKRVERAVLGYLIGPAVK